MAEKTAFTPTNPKYKLCISDKTNPDGPMTEIAAFWDTTSKAGKKYLSGKIKQTITLNEGEYLSLFPFEPKKK